MKILNLIFILTITLSISFAGWQLKEDTPVPEPIHRGGGITYGRGYVFAIAGNGSKGFYAFNISRDSWVTLPRLPFEIYRDGGITYGKSEVIAFNKLFKLEHVFVLARIASSPDRIFIYNFVDTISPNGYWKIYELPAGLRLGPGASITFRPTKHIQYIPGRYCYKITLGELYFTRGDSTPHFYYVPISQYYSPIIHQPANPVDWVFPPDNGEIDAIKIFFRWETIPNANYYHLQVDDNPDFSSPILDITTENNEHKNIYIPEKIFSNGLYYWRIRPDNSPIWSEVRKFQVILRVFPRRDVPEEVGDGGSIVYHYYDDSFVAESIYCLVGERRGRGRTSFYCYSPNRDEWFSLPSTPLPQNGGSSLTSCYRSNLAPNRLLAIFGYQQSLQPHWIYRITSRPRWQDGDEIPQTLFPGASITYDWVRRDAYLVIGGGRRHFYINPNPSYDEEESFSGGQSLTINKKTEILFNSKGIILSYSCEIPSYGEISVYNLYGRKIKTLFNGRIEKGECRLIWNKKDENGRKVSSGIYFIKINLKEKQESIKVILHH